MQKKAYFPWLAGIAAATALLALVALTEGFWYYGSDDVPILRTFMGYEGGVPSAFHLYVHTFFAWPCSFPFRREYAPDDGQCARMRVGPVWHGFALTQRKARGWQWPLAASAAGLAGGGLLLFYLAYVGRLQRPLPQLAVPACPVRH